MGSLFSETFVSHGAETNFGNQQKSLKLQSSRLGGSIFGKGEVRVYTGSGGHAEKFCLYYVGPGSHRARWLQFIRRSVVLTGAGRSGEKSTGVEGSVHLEGREYSFTNQKSPAKTNWNTDSNDAADPFYGGKDHYANLRYQRVTAMFDGPTPLFAMLKRCLALNDDKLKLYATGKTKSTTITNFENIRKLAPLTGIRSDAHFKSYLVFDGKSVCEVTISVCYTLDKTEITNWVEDAARSGFGYILTAKPRFENIAIEESELIDKQCAARLKDQYPGIDLKLKALSQAFSSKLGLVTRGY